MILIKQDLGVLPNKLYHIRWGFVIQVLTGNQSFQGPNVKQPGLASWATNKYKTESYKLNLLLTCSHESLVNLSSKTAYLNVL